MVPFDEYRRLRRENPTLSARNALAWAKAKDRETRLEWDTFGNHVGVGTCKREGFDITVFVDYDEYGGDYPVSETDVDTGIKNPDYHGPDDYYRQHKPFLELESGETLPELAKYYRKAGMAKNVAWEFSREALANEAKQYRSDDYIRVVFRAEARFEGVVVGRAAGFASDFVIDWRGGFEQDLDEAVYDTDLIEEAIEDARETVARIVAKSNNEGLTSIH